MSTLLLSLLLFKYFNVDGCHTLEFIINCEQFLGRWKVHLMTSGMKGVMLGMLTMMGNVAMGKSIWKSPACWGFPDLHNVMIIGLP